MTAEALSNPDPQEVISMDRNSWALPTADAANKHNNVVQTANLARSIPNSFRVTQIDGVPFRLGDTRTPLPLENIDIERSLREGRRTRQRGDEPCDGSKKTGEPIRTSGKPRTRTHQSSPLKIAT